MARQLLDQTGSSKKSIAKRLSSCSNEERSTLLCSQCVPTVEPRPPIGGTDTEIPCMERILDRYERYLLCEGGDVMEDHPKDMQGNMSYDYIKLRSRIEALQKSQRNLMGEQLESLTFREIQQLEHQIDSALRNIRSRKDRVLLKSIEDLQKKERFMMEQNSLLEKEKAAMDASLHGMNSAASSPAAAAALPNMNMCAGDSNEPAGPPAATSLPRWMLRSAAVGQRGG